MTDPREIIEHWVGDFCTSTAFVDHPSLVREYAPEVLSAFLQTACAARGLSPADLEEADLKAGLLNGVTRLEMPASVRADVPPLCASFLTEMEAGGRLSGGRALGLFVQALRTPYLEAAGGAPAPIRSVASKLGRNEPCPCGSGRKYKKCCMGRLGD
jgi:hypothetical protein